jgi:hypothetical protein
MHCMASAYGLRHLFIKPDQRHHGHRRDRGAPRSRRNVDLDIERDDPGCRAMLRSPYRDRTEDSAGDGASGAPAGPVSARSA